jgi:hypothetical protein
MNILYNIVVVTAEDNLSCHCDTQQDTHYEDTQLRLLSVNVSGHLRLLWQFKRLDKFFVKFSNIKFY